MKFSIKNRKDLKIVGNVTIPENPTGLAFLIHGLGVTKDHLLMVKIAETFLENNYIVVSFDATNSFGESEGNYENATMQLHYEDLVDVIDWSKTQDWYIESFVLAGSSLGGYAVVRYAEEYPSIVKAVFPLAAVVSGELSLKATEKYEGEEEFKKWKETGWFERNSVSMPGTIKRLPYSHMEERLKHNLLLNASKLVMPVLIVVGENDGLCPPADQKVLWDVLPKNEYNEFHIIPGAPHTFRTPEHLAQMKEVIGTWIKKIK